MSAALRSLVAAVSRRPRALLAAQLSAPLGWIVLVYLGSLAVLLLHALWVKDSFTGKEIGRAHV